MYQVLGPAVPTAEELRTRASCSTSTSRLPASRGPADLLVQRPLPGPTVAEILRRQLDPSRCLYVGASAQDPAFAQRLGFK